MADKSQKITPFEKEQLDVLKAINKSKLSAEANVVSTIYKYPSLLIETNITEDEFSNQCWKIYFQIAHGIIITEQKNSLDEIAFNIYLDKHPKLSSLVENYDGYEGIEATAKYINKDNFDGYLAELRKYNALTKLCKRGFPISKESLSKYNDMTSGEIYDLFSAYLNDTFANVDNDIKSYDITVGLDALLDELDAGLAIGLPYYSMDLLTKETGGQYLGSITLVGGLSNVGKSTFARNTVLPAVIENNEKIVVMLNEDGLKKWQRELIVYVANNFVNKDLPKHVVRDGNYTSETRATLEEAKQWIIDKIANHTITVVPFQNYQTEKAIKTILKYSNLGVKYFMLDTYKMDAGKVSDNSWLEMQQNMVAINDVIKPEANNLHILITFQLAKGSIKQRYYTQDNIGVAKNIIDPASTCIMIRDVYDDEKPGGARELKVYKLAGKKNNTKIECKLDPEKRYQILFIVKNREGAANQQQIVIEHDMSRNKMSEVGVCQVPVDF